MADGCVDKAALLNIGVALLDSLNVVLRQYRRIVVAHAENETVVALLVFKW
jgi:hypothetical protein